MQIQDLISKSPSQKCTMSYEIRLWEMGWMVIYKFISHDLSMPNAKPGSASFLCSYREGRDFYLRPRKRSLPHKVWPGEKQESRSSSRDAFPCPEFCPGKWTWTLGWEDSCQKGRAVLSPSSADSRACCNMPQPGFVKADGCNSRWDGFFVISVLKEVSSNIISFLNSKLQKIK